MSRLVTAFESAHAIATDLVPFAKLAVLVPLALVAWYVFADYGEWKRSFTSSADAAQVTANAYAEVGFATTRILDEKVGPAFDTFVARAGETFDGFDRTNAELRKQIGPLAASAGRTVDIAGDGLATNSGALFETQSVLRDDLHTALGSTNALLLASGQTMTLTGEEIGAVGRELEATGHAVRIITEDPSIAATLDNVQAITANTARTSDSLSHTAATADRWAQEKLYPPPPKGFWRKFGYGLKVTAQYVALGAQGYWALRLAR